MFLDKDDMCLGVHGVDEGLMTAADVDGEDIMGPSRSQVDPARPGSQHRASSSGVSLPWLPAAAAGHPAALRGVAAARAVWGDCASMRGGGLFLATFRSSCAGGALGPWPGPVISLR